MAKKKQKVRVRLRKNRQNSPPKLDLTRKVRAEGVDAAELPAEQRVSGKGDLTRYRTLVGVADESSDELLRAVDESACLKGRVLSAHGASCDVQAEDGRVFACTVRRVVLNFARDERTAVIAGDHVLFAPVGQSQGVIERVNPRRGTLSRETRGRRHMLVANVDQVLIVATAADPPLKPSLIDRYLISAERGELQAILCINKADLVDRAAVQPVVDLYSRLGYTVLLTSARDNFGIEPLRKLLADRATVVAGQSGVGKSSLLNAIQPGLSLRTAEVSVESRKGRHTTSTASLLQLSGGGWVVDTPGIRQFELWDVQPAEVAGFFIEFRPFLTRCKYPDCTHTHESECGVKEAVHDGLISHVRYESYIKIKSGDMT